MKLFGDEYLTLDETAEMLGIHRTTLQFWIRKDKAHKNNNEKMPDNIKCPPYGRMGNRYRFRKEDVEQFIKESMGE